MEFSNSNIFNLRNPRKLRHFNNSFTFIFEFDEVEISALSKSGVFTPAYLDFSGNLFCGTDCAFGSVSKWTKLTKADSSFISNLYLEVLRYGFVAGKLAKKENFDVIHAHDWLSFLAGIAAKKVSKKSLIAHVHATEFDRVGSGTVNRDVYKIEKEGMEKADKIIVMDGGKIVEEGGPELAERLEEKGYAEYVKA